MQATQKHKSTIQIILIVLNSCQGMVFFGYCLSYFNVSISTLMILLNISPQNQDLIEGIITTSIPLGALIGCLISGPLMKSISRKNLFLLADLIGAIGTIINMTLSLSSIIVGRIIMGISVGINSACVPIYIKESVPQSLTGMFGAFIGLSIQIGVTIAATVGLGFEATPVKDNIGNYWKFEFGLPLLFLITRSVLLLFVFKNETPLWCILNDRKEAANIYIKQIYRPQYQNEVQSDYEVEAERVKNLKETYSELLLRENRGRFLLSLGIMTIQQCVGATAVVFYSSKLFTYILIQKYMKSITTNSNIARYLNIGVGVVSIIGCTICSIVSKQVGRKTLMTYGILNQLTNILGIFCQAAFLGFMGGFYIEYNQSGRDVYSSFLVAFVYLFLFTSALTIQPVAWVFLYKMIYIQLFCAEITNDKGMSIAVFVQWFFIAIIGLIMPILTKSLGVAGVCFMFSILCLASVLFLAIFVKETKGLSPKEIFNLYLPDHLAQKESTGTSLLTKVQ